MRRFIIFILTVFVSQVFGQESQQLTLEEVISVAQSKSPEVKLAELKKSNAYWNYQSYLGNYRPEINLGITAPDLRRDVSAVTQPNGRDIFVTRSQMSSDVRLSLSQSITATGATVYASTGVNRLDLFKTDAFQGGTSYLSQPIEFGFDQPILGYNALKWDKRIEPLRYEETQAIYSEEMEAVANNAVRSYFDLMVAQLNLEAAFARKEVADTLFNLGESRYSVGNIAETELLQLQMDVMRADSDISNQTLNVQTSNERLRDFLGIQDNINFELILAEEIPEVFIDESKALEEATKNRSQIKALQRRLLEAESNVDRQKATAGVSGTLTGSVGVTGFGDDLSGAYSGLLDQERVRLSLNIPIADWGKGKARMEIAKSNYELVKQNTVLDSISFEREVIIAVQQFELVKDNVEIGKLSYETAQKRYDLTRKRYMIGKVDITDLTLAENEQENQRRQYIQAIRDFWLAYYGIRALTLYDFIENRSLVRT